MNAGAKEGHQAAFSVELPKNLPVYGTDVAGDDTKITISNSILDYVTRPPGIARAKDCYALRVVNASMEPRFKEGDLIIVNPHIPARKGDDVVIHLINNEDGPNELTAGFVKKLIKKSPKNMTLLQHNPKKTITIPMQMVQKVHRILTPSELMGY